MTEDPEAPFDLEALDMYLLSDLAPDDGMTLSVLDGYLTAIALCPEPISTEDWLPPIWSNETPRFESEAEEEQILHTILGHYKQIAAGLASDPGEVSPIFDEDQEGTVIASEWAAGFLDGMALRTSAWAPLIEHPTAYVILAPIMLLGDYDPDEDEEIEAQWERLMVEAPEVIPVCIGAIHDFWREHKARKTPAPRRPKRRS